MKNEEEAEGEVEEHEKGGKKKEEYFSPYLSNLVVNFDHLQLVMIRKRLNKNVVPILKVRNSSGESSHAAQVLQGKRRHDFCHDLGGGRQRSGRSRR